MRPTFPSLRHQPRSLQCLLHPRVAQFDGMFVPKFLVEVPDVEIEIDFPVEPQNLLGPLHRHPMRTLLPAAPVPQAVITELLISLSHPAHRPVTNSDDLRRVQPADLLRHRFQNHVL